MLELIRKIKWLKINGSFFIAGAALLWALDGILRRSLFSLPPITIVFYEHLLGLMLLLPFLGQKIIKLVSSFTKKNWLDLILISLLSGVLGTLWFTAALGAVNYIPFSVVFLLQKLQPLFAIIFANLILGEKITKKYFSFALLALVASFFVTFPNGRINFSDSGYLMAALYAVGAALAWGSSTSFSKRLLKKFSHLETTGLRFGLTTVFAGAVVLLSGPAFYQQFPNLSQVSRLLVIALSTGMVAMLLYYRGLKTTKVKVATIIELLFPLVAVLIDAVLYRTWLVPSQYLAAGVLLWAIYRVSNLNKLAETK